MEELQKREAELNKNNQEGIKIVEKGAWRLKTFYVPKTHSKNQNVNRKLAPSKNEFVDVRSDEVKIACKILRSWG